MKRKAFKKIGLILSSCLLAFTLIACSLMEAMGKEIPLTDLAAEYKGEATDENGNLLAPFDVVYPEAFESGEYEYDKTSVLLKMRKTFNGRVTTNIRNCGIYKMDKFLETKDGDWYRAKIKSDEDVTTVIKKTRSLSEILMSDYDYIYEEKDEEWEVSNPTVDCKDKLPEKVHNNEKAGQQWYLTSSGIQQAWKFLEKEGYDAGGSSSVTVAVIDTGVDYTHPDLVDNMWVNSAEIPNNGIDDDDNGFIDDVHGANVIANNGYGDMANTGNPMDDHGHGTHVAGIVAATNNKQGIVGVAYNAKIMAVKAGQATGVFLQSDIAEAILYAYSMGADVINMSFGGSACSIPVQDALMQAYTTCTLVAAAGNDGQPNEWSPCVPPYKVLPSYPAALSYVVGVMSVDYRGVESAFTNWDVIKYNTTEYEVYAPGEAILSTLPGGRYGKLNGTSMAAPVVSGVAALLRSYFADRDMYPSKFIAAQLSATSEDVVACYNFEEHLEHNIPVMVNAYDALTKLPKPEVTLNNYYLYDNIEFSSKNNGDGVVDAGETINIAPVLRNRWGMSKDTIITIDAITGIDGLDLVNPYVEIITGTLNYGSVGTFSTKDELIRDGSIVLGCEKPWVIKIADNCPNDYLINLNVTITCQNGLDEKDSETYVFEQSAAISFWVRNGLVLPSQIKEDMTLTKDNYYIIPNATYIAEGVTVTVEPGTKIQFWSDDPSDPYADEYIAYLNVAGNFITRGTPEEPVEMFPSDMMSYYIVEIVHTNTGYVDLSYTNIVNPNVCYTYADHCKFTQNYVDILYGRGLNNGNIQEYNSMHMNIECVKTTNSIFYKLSANYVDGANLYGKYDTCTFADSEIDVEIIGSNIYGQKYAMFDNCVFVGNYILTNDGYVHNSSITVHSPSTMEILNVFRNDKTGTTYMVIDVDSMDVGFMEEYLDSIGGYLACLETKEEFEFLVRSIDNNSSNNFYVISSINKSFTKWENGKDFNIDVPCVDEQKYNEVYTALNYHYFEEWENGNYHNFDAWCITRTTLENKKGFVIEIPGDIYCESIIDIEPNINTIDKDTLYQIKVDTEPKDCDKSKFIYISGDKNIATVDENGVVTPIKEGTVEIYIYSNDFQTYAVKEIKIIGKIPLQDFDAYVNNNQINVGEKGKVNVDLSPANTTENYVTFESSNSEILTIDSMGNYEAHKIGSVDIIVSVKGYTEIIHVNVVKAVKSIAFEDDFYNTYLEDTDTSWKPTVLPVDATNKNIIWTSSNPEIAFVNEDGELIRVSVGNATIRATVENTNIYDELHISINEIEIDEKTEITQIIRHGNDELIVTSNNELYIWNGNMVVAHLLGTNVKAISLTNNSVGNQQLYAYVLDTNGNLIKRVVDFKEKILISSTEDELIMTDVKKLFVTDQTHHYFVKIDGSLWGFGDNNGSLGDGTMIKRDYPVQLLIGDVIDVKSNENRTYFLCGNGDVYLFDINNVSGKLVLTDINCIRGFTHWDYVFISNKGVTVSLYNNTVLDAADHYGSNWRMIDGKIINDYGYDFSKIKDPTYIYPIHQDKAFIYTKEGEVYSVGFDGSKEPQKMVFNVKADGDLTLEKTNIDNVIFDNKMVLDFNKTIVMNNSYSYISLVDSSGNNISIKKNINLDKLTIESYSKLIHNETYTLTIPKESISSIFGNVNEEITYTFVYKNDTKIELISSSITNDEAISHKEFDATFVYTFAEEGENFNSIKVLDKEGKEQLVDVILSNNELSLTGTLEFGEYTIIIPENALKDNVGGYNEETIVSFAVAEKVNLIESSIENDDDRVDETKDITFTFTNVTAGQNITNIQLKDSLGKLVSVAMTLENNVLTIDHDGLKQNEHYTLLIPEDTVKDYLGNGNEEILIEFTTYSPIEIIASSIKDDRVHINPNINLHLNGEVSVDKEKIAIYNGEIKVDTRISLKDRTLTISASNLDYNSTYRLVLLEGALIDEKGCVTELYEQEFTTIEFIDRFYWTENELERRYEPYIYDNHHFYNNVILNNFNDTDVEHWLRVQSTAHDKNDFSSIIGLAHNYWGTTNEMILNRQIVDFDDYQSLNDIELGEILKEAPSNTFPYVTNIEIYNSNGEKVTTVSNETIRVVVSFNRDMDTSIPLRVRFGSMLPYADYEIKGSYVSARVWEGTYTLKTLIENGNQYFNISNGRAADNSYLELYETLARFIFEIDTTSAQAMIMQADATKEGITLTWEQDDFDTLAGFNVYRSDHENGYYQKINDYVIPYDTKEFFDDTVEPGKVYYYNFTVVKTDLSESTPSGKVVVRSLDTMAPNIYHSPVKTAYTGSNLLVSATVTDNLQVSNVKLYYRVLGTDEWKSTSMNALNSRYTGIIPSEFITEEGIEYYIDAYDGISHAYKGSAEIPYQVVVKEAISSDSYGDVDGDGVISVKDALMLLQAANDQLNLTEEEFRRADINQDGILSASEALRILQYVSGKISSIVG